MMAALRTELRKIFTTRAWWVTASLMAGYMALMAVIMAFSLVFGMREAESSGTPSDMSGGLGANGPVVLDAMAVRASATA